MSQKRKMPCIDAALKMLGRRDYAVKELTQKLLEKEYETEDVTQVINRLIELKYLNDERYASGRVKYRAEISRWGIKRIQQELFKKGVPSNISEQAINAWNDETTCASKWQEQANVSLIKKYGQWPHELDNDVETATSYELKQISMKLKEKEKAKRLNFLIRRGYSPKEAQIALEASK